MCNSCAINIYFLNEDLLLGTKLHNHPLFVKCYIREQKVNRIIVDDGSVVNIMPLKTMKDLGIALGKLMQCRSMIQGFNQGGQRAIRKITLQMLINNIESSVLFNVIDNRTTYNYQANLGLTKIGLFLLHCINVSNTAEMDMQRRQKLIVNLLRQQNLILLMQNSTQR